MKDKILVVDDEEIMRRSLGDILRLEGYRVQTASSGEAALKALKRESFDLLLLDLKMPGMDGLEVLEEASHLAPDTMVILLTAHGSLESAIEALRHEAFDYLLKPASTEQILSSVASALARHKESERRKVLLDQLTTSLQELKGVEKREVNAPLDQNIVPLGIDIQMDIARREIWQGQYSSPVCKIKLTATESKLMRVLLENRNRVLNHRELVLMVQGYEVTDWEAPEVLRPLVSRLRQKLANFEGGEEWIVNIRGTGYVLEVKEATGPDLGD
ncbi:MAG: response regulator [Omnitrophica WOR_2 bacterium]